MLDPTRSSPPSSNSSTLTRVPASMSIVWNVRSHGRPNRPFSTAKLSSFSFVQTHSHSPVKSSERAGSASGDSAGSSTSSSSSKRACSALSSGTSPAPALAARSSSSALRAVRGATARYAEPPSEAANAPTAPA
eukprot:6796156-Prymnesium_polylepis.1